MLGCECAVVCVCACARVDLCKCLSVHVCMCVCLWCLGCGSATKGFTWGFIGALRAWQEPHVDTIGHRSATLVDIWISVIFISAKGFDFLCIVQVPSHLQHADVDVGIISPLDRTLSNEAINLVAEANRSHWPPDPLIREATRVKEIAVRMHQTSARILERRMNPYPSANRREGYTESQGAKLLASDGGDAIGVNETHFESIGSDL